VTTPNISTEPLVVLYVEDNAYVRDSVAEILANPARQFVCVGDRKGALEVLRAGRVDLLLTDVNLPDGSGMDLVREALQHHPSMPVIICSSHDLAAAPRLLGPNVHVLRKPFEPDELEALVERLAVQQP
jgi:DNA-binding NtrC family response regulator